jgi:hypothetical protein
MNRTAVTLAAFAAALALVFTIGYGTGQLFRPAATELDHTDDMGMDDHMGGMHGDHGDADDLPGGLLVSDRGYTLVPVTTGNDGFAFRISGPDGDPVTRYAVAHDKRMHLIVVRRDLSGFRHVHPTMDADGTWRVASPLGDPGIYRAYADFKPAGGDPLVLGVDVPVAGDFEPRPLPGPSRRATVDGYTVTLSGTLRAGRSSKLTLTVTRDGKPVTDLQPYLGAYGHLVALRQGDLAYLHVHPDEAADAGPGITFHAEVPSAGTYRLYLDFRHGGTVRTAEFTAVAGR